MAWYFVKVGDVFSPSPPYFHSSVMQLCVRNVVYFYVHSTRIFHMRIFFTNARVTYWPLPGRLVCGFQKQDVQLCKQGTAEMPRKLRRWSTETSICGLTKIYKTEVFNPKQSLGSSQTNRRRKINKEQKFLIYCGLFVLILVGFFVVVSSHYVSAKFPLWPSSGD